MRTILFSAALILLPTISLAQEAQSSLPQDDMIKALRQQRDELQQRASERDAVIAVLQQQRNEAMDRGAAAAGQLMVAQKRIADLEKAAKGAQSEQTPSADPSK